LVAREDDAPAAAAVAGGGAPRHAEIEGQKAEIERLLGKSEQANRAKSEFLAHMSTN